MTARRHALAAYLLACSVLAAVAAGQLPRTALVVTIALTAAGFILERLPALRRSIMRRYRIRLYDSTGYELLAGQRYMAMLDLADGPGLYAARAELDARIAEMIALAEVEHGPARGYRMTVEPWDGGPTVLDWTR